MARSLALAFLWVALCAVYAVCAYAAVERLAS